MLEKLKTLFGSDWELEINSIKRACSNRAEEEKEKAYKNGLKVPETHWTEMFFVLDYKKIVEDYWGATPDSEENFTTFSQEFSIDVGMGFNSKKDRTKWMMIFNQYRNLWAHEGSKEKGLNREEVQFLEKVHRSFVTP